MRQEFLKNVFEEDKNPEDMQLYVIQANSLDD
jgi:hypothetical protein